MVTLFNNHQFLCIVFILSKCQIHLFNNVYPWFQLRSPEWNHVIFIHFVSYFPGRLLFIMCGPGGLLFLDVGKWSFTGIVRVDLIKVKYLHDVAMYYIVYQGGCYLKYSSAGNISSVMHTSGNVYDNFQTYIEQNKQHIWIIIICSVFVARSPIPCKAGMLPKMRIILWEW